MADIISDVVIRGFLVATERDRRGRPIEIAVETDDFQQYIIDHAGKGHELIQYLSEEVHIQGKIMGADYRGNQIIEITDYTIIHTIPPI